MRRDDEWLVGSLNPRRVVDWLYVTRLSVALAVYGSAIVIQEIWLPSGSGPSAMAEIRTVSLVGLSLAAVLTGGSYLWTHLRGREISLRFLYGQAVLDVGLVTGIVHITGGNESVFPPLLYIALVSVYAVLVPFRAALLITAIAAVSYVADMAFAYPAELDLTVAFQIVVFVAVAAASGSIGSRLREVREELETVEGTLRRLRLDTADILRSLGAGVVTLDEDGRVAYMNPAAGTLLDLDVEEWLDRDVREVLERRSPGVLSVFRDTFRRERGITEREAEIRHPGRAGAVPVTVASAYLWRSGARASVTLVLQDLRPVRQLEELRTQADRLQAVAELAASLAHEIRNPLASIQSAVDQLTSQEDPDPSGKRLEALVRRESDRLDRLLGEFTDFAGIAEVQPEPVDVRDLLEEVVDVSREDPAADGVRLQVRVEEEVDRVQGDPDLLHRALLNLVLNAMQAWQESRADGDPGLTVDIAAESMPPEVVPPRVVMDDAVRILVRDDGPGIPGEDLDRIFDPFFSRRQGGTGLGLSIVYRTVRAHGGSITVSSTVGEGTIFELALPRRVEERRGAPAGEPST